MTERTRNARLADRGALPKPTGAPTVPNLRSEAEDVQRAQGGDRHAMAKLVESYSLKLFQFHIRLLHDEEVAADATQEVFLKVQRHFEVFDPTRSFRSWIYGIAWNVARDHLRRRVRRRRTEVGSIDQNTSLAKEGRGQHADTIREPADPRSRTPSEELETKERSKWVRDALDLLAPTQRALLLLREFEGLSYAELSELLGCEPGTVKSRLNRARHGLTQALVSRRLDADSSGHRQGPLS